MSWGGCKVLVLKKLVFGACCAYSLHERHERSIPPYLVPWSPESLEQSRFVGSSDMIQVKGLGFRA